MYTASYRLIVVFTACILGCGGNVASTLSPEAVAADSQLGVNQPIPELSFVVLSGGQWSTAAARGDVVVIDVWASYCKPCVKAFPKLNEMAGEDIQVVGISVDEEDRDVVAFLDRVPAKFIVARDPDMTVRDGPLAISKLPTVVVVDRRGTVRYRKEATGEADYEYVHTLVAELLAED